MELNKHSSSYAAGALLKQLVLHKSMPQAHAAAVHTCEAPVTTTCLLVIAAPAMTTSRVAGRRECRADALRALAVVNGRWVGQGANIWYAPQRSSESQQLHRARLHHQQRH